MAANEAAFDRREYDRINQRATIQPKSARTLQQVMRFLA